MSLLKELTVPLMDEDVTSLEVGESVLLNGIICTARDAVHKWLMETFVVKKKELSMEDEIVFQEIRNYLSNGVIYHCGPIVSQDGHGGYRVLAAGPTTSIREEEYEADVIKLFNVKAVIGKGGMGERTLNACKEGPAVYLHAVGGAAVLLGKTVEKVLGVMKLEFGIPEAIWVMKVADFPAIVTMDAHGNSLHSMIEENSKRMLEQFLGT